MENTIDITENEECNSIYYDITPNPFNPLTIKINPDTGIVLNAKTGKEITLNDFSVHLNITIETVIEIVMKNVNQERRKSNV